MLKMDLQLFGEDEDEDQEKDSKKNKDGEELPQWAKDLQETVQKLSRNLSQKPNGNKEEGTPKSKEIQKVAIPPIAAPKPEEQKQDPPTGSQSSEPKAKKKFLDWLL